jgi:hypothetical protein
VLLLRPYDLKLLAIYYLSVNNVIYPKAMEKASAEPTEKLVLVFAASEIC